MEITVDHQDDNREVQRPTDWPVQQIKVNEMVDGKEENALPKDEDGDPIGTPQNEKEINVEEELEVPPSKQEADKAAQERTKILPNPKLENRKNGKTKSNNEKEK
ncbi:hypothetical protein AVEN_165178-1 [Araneus ventricosus]|uniref:Uncharacterized protein n=1 Tax=Araneus ventricosus TaxID=182803 RepID=A0A4Y2B5C8_ARAVE|nr:hypothetical protein AVEN_165178-1 [Araneus ventricosus]